MVAFGFGKTCAFYVVLGSLQTLFGIGFGPGMSWATPVIRIPFM